MKTEATKAAARGEALRPPGRPPMLGEPLAPLTARIPAEVKRLMQERAEAEGVGLSDVLRPVLEREFRPERATEG